MRLCEEAIEIALRVGARAAEGHARNTLGLDYAADGRCDEAIASLQVALEIAREIEDADDIGRAYVNLNEALRSCGDVRGALACVHEGAAATDAVGVSRTYGRFIRENGIAIAFDLGDWVEASRLAEETVAFDQAGRQARRYLLANWLPLLVAQGDERAADGLDELRQTLEGYPVETQFNAPSRMADAEAALWRGAPAEALAYARTGIDELETTRFHRYHLRLFHLGLRAAADLAVIARARRDPAAEREAVAAGEAVWADLEIVLERWRGRQRGPDRTETEAEAALSAAEHERLAGRPSAAAWTEAVRRWRAEENPYAVAYARWREGEAQMEAADRASAATALTDAWSIADRLGARPLRGAVEALATRARIPVGVAASGTPGAPDAADGTAAGDATAATKPALTAVDAAAATAASFGLTRRELDVLPLLIQGRTNRQIAEALFVSESTAGVHVSNILGKLGATSRTEAATIAVRIGLDGPGPGA
jgi:DNA-binding CsgD family transcriptional regulator